MADLNLADGLAILERRARTVRIAMIAFIAFSLADVVVVIGEIAGAVDIDAAELSLMSGLGALVYALFAVAMVIAIVVVAMWIHGAHANLRAAGMIGLEFTPGWAVGWYFIPIANLFKPFQAMRELWNRSLAEDEGFGQDTPSRLKTWWGTWIAGNIVSNIGVRLQSLGGAEAVTVGHALDIVSTLLLVVAGWLLLQIVEAVSAAQRGGVTLAHAFA